MSYDVAFVLMNKTRIERNQIENKNQTYLYTETIHSLKKGGGTLEDLA